MSVIEISEAPNVTRLLARAAVPRRRRATTLPETTLIQRDIAIDRDHLAAYDAVCGFRVRDTLPWTYPHILGFGLSVQLMTRPDFPFALPGMVHIANRITQHRELTADDVLTVEVSATDLRPHGKGRQFGIVTTTTVDGATAWTGASTYLRRGDHGTGSPEEIPEHHNAATQLPTTGVWNVARDTGRRYAAVSGDRNPIHLSPVTARLFGFPRAIAHGMWSKANCLAALEDRLPLTGTVGVRFAKPIMLPSRVDFAADVQATSTLFCLRNPHTGAPHLTGRIEP